MPVGLFLANRSTPHCTHTRTRARTPHRLIRGFSSKSCASKVTKAAVCYRGSPPQPPTHPPPTVASDIFRDAHHPTSTTSTNPLIHMCPTAQAVTQHARTARSRLRPPVRVTFIVHLCAPLQNKQKSVCLAWGFWDVTVELPLRRGSQQLPQQLIACGAWMGAAEDAGSCSLSRLRMPNLKEVSSFFLVRFGERMTPVVVSGILKESTK